MEYLFHIGVGILMTYIGLLPPGMMNMTVVNHSIQSGIRPSLKFSMGASCIVAIQALIALTFAQLLSENPSILETLKKLAIVVFMVLAVYFFRMARKSFNYRTADSKKNFFVGGLLMSAMNMLAIPFFFGYCTLMELKGWIVIDEPQLYFFVLGAVLGSFGLFSTYAFFADYISKRVSFIAQNINYILSALFLILTVITVINVLN